MSVAVELWHAQERWNPLQKRAADGTWGDGAGRFHGYAGTVHLDRNDEGGLDIGIGSAAFGSSEDDGHEGHTARLSPEGARQLHARLAAAIADGKRRQAAVDAHWEQHGTGPAGDSHEIIASGYVAGEGADVHYSVELDDPDVGVQTYLAAIPHASDETLSGFWDSGKAAVFDTSETGKLVGRLAAASRTAESTALALWRALEAWDPNAKRHRIDKGLPGAGRFMPSAGGGEGGKPSLAAVIKGTAANGPKRDRHKASSVAGAVRQAARMSDTTGRPTQRTPDEHRAHGAHDVADEVDRALADAGVSEDVRRQVADRARAVADSHGARPGSPPKPKPAARRAPRPSFDQAQTDAVVARLDPAGSLDEARTHLAGLTASQLRQVATQAGVAVGSGDTKARIQDRIVNSVVGRRLDSEAIDRIVRG